MSDTLKDIGPRAEEFNGADSPPEVSDTVDLHAYQDALVRKGLEDMRSGRVVSHEEVVRKIQKLRGRRIPRPHPVRLLVRVIT